MYLHIVFLNIEKIFLVDLFYEDNTISIKESLRPNYVRKHPVGLHPYICTYMCHIEQEELLISFELF